MPDIYIPSSQSLIGAFRQGRTDRMADEEMRLKIAEAQEAREKKAAWKGAMGRAFDTGSVPTMEGAMTTPPAEQGAISSTMAPRWNEQTRSYDDAPGMAAPASPQITDTRGKSSRPRLNPEALKEMLIIDPEAALKLHEAFSKMDEADLKKHEGKNKVLGSMATYLMTVPESQRGQALQSVAPQLLDAGWSVEELRQANLSDDGLKSYQALAVDAEKLMTEARQEKEFGATERHRRVTEGQGERRLSVSEGALSVARQREGRIASGKGGDGDNSDLNYLMGGN